MNDITKKVKWKCFKISDIFSVKTLNYKKMHLVTETSDINNGISSRVLIPEIHQGNSITMSSDMKYVHYQGEMFVTYPGVIVLTSEMLNENIGLYIVTILRKVGEIKSYKKYNLSQIVNMEIKLPVTENDEIDWKYMCEYIATLKKKTYN